jgi:hypothetical protein
LSTSCRFTLATTSNDASGITSSFHRAVLRRGR